MHLGNKMSSTTKVYFPNLNGLRFFAALAVVITHIELFKLFLGYEGIWINHEWLSHQVPLIPVLKGEVHWLSPFVSNSGGIGVVFFFALSGFLITYLLFVENEVQKCISVKAFYIRRILRIWPLYYWLVILGFVILPFFTLFDVPDQAVNLTKHFWPNLVFFIFFVPNVAFSMFTHAVPNVGQLWSIGVEEQFYLIWPWIVRKSKNFIKTMITFTLILLFIKAAFLLYSQGNDAEWVKSVKKFLAMSKLESMSIGGIGAWILYSKRDDLLKFIYNPIVLIIALIGIPALIYITPLSFQNVVYLAYSVCSVIIILNFAGNAKLKNVLENRVLDFLGKISFGIYMYHMLVVTFVLNFSRDYLKLGYFPEGAIRREVSLTENILIYTLVIGLTILLASLSYLYFEKRFIKMKWKVTKVVSGDHAK